MTLKAGVGMFRHGLSETAGALHSRLGTLAEARSPEACASDTASGSILLQAQKENTDAHLKITEVSRPRIETSDVNSSTYARTLLHSV